MLKEQAINLLTQGKEIILGSESWLDSTHQPIEEAFSMAIEAIKSMQHNAPNVLNALDTIYRQAAINEIEERINAHSLGNNVALISELNRLEGYILHLPSAQPELKKGKWIVHPEVKNVYGGTYIECSQCGEKYVVQHMEDEKYCRNCGAKMGE